SRPAHPRGWAVPRYRLRQCDNPNRFAALLSRCGMKPQQLRYCIRRPRCEPAFRRDRDVFHIFFRRCEGAARPNDAEGAMHQGEVSRPSPLELSPGFGTPCSTAESPSTARTAAWLAYKAFSAPCRRCPPPALRSDWPALAPPLRTRAARAESTRCTDRAPPPPPARLCP